MVDGTRWRQGTPSANLADQAKRLYGDRYAEFLDGVKAFAFFPLAVWKGECKGRSDDLRSLLPDRRPHRSGRRDRLRHRRGRQLLGRPRERAREQPALLQGGQGQADRSSRPSAASTRATRTWHTLDATIKGTELVATLDGKERVQPEARPIPGGSVRPLVEGRLQGALRRFQRAVTDAQKLIATRSVRGLADGVVSVVLATYLTGLGLSPFEVGAIVTGTLLGSAAVTLAVGLLGYRFSRRRIFCRLPRPDVRYRSRLRWLHRLLAADARGRRPDAEPVVRRRELVPSDRASRPGSHRRGGPARTMVFAWYNLAGRWRARLGRC